MGFLILRYVDYRIYEVLIGVVILVSFSSYAFYFLFKHQKKVNDEEKGIKPVASSSSFGSIFSSASMALDRFSSNSTDKETDSDEDDKAKTTSPGASALPSNKSAYSFQMDTNVLSEQMDLIKGAQRGD